MTTFQKTYAFIPLLNAIFIWYAQNITVHLVVETLHSLPLSQVNTYIPTVSETPAKSPSASTRKILYTPQTYSISKPRQLLSPKDQKLSVNAPQVVTDSSLLLNKCCNCSATYVLKKNSIKRGRGPFLLSDALEVLFWTEVSQQYSVQKFIQFMTLSHRKIHLKKYSFYRGRKGTVYSKWCCAFNDFKLQSPPL